MPKASGNTRVVRPTSKTRTQSYKDYIDGISSGLYDVELSKFYKTKGGFLLVSKERKYDDNEYKAAEAMAKDGLIVKLTPEGKIEFSTGRTNNGDPVYADGLVNGYSYEQQTKNPLNSDKESLEKSVDGAIKHAYDKRAEIPLIYDRYARFHRDDIEAGLKRFEERNQYRFKAILVVDKHGNVWEHRHNK